MASVNHKSKGHGQVIGAYNKDFKYMNTTHVGIYFIQDDRSQMIMVMKQAMQIIYSKLRE